jgi:hypothetical protein
MLDLLAQVEVVISFALLSGCRMATLPIKWQYSHEALSFFLFYLSTSCTYMGFVAGVFFSV